MEVALPEKSCQATKSGSGLTLVSLAFMYAMEFLGKSRWKYMLAGCRGKDSPPTTADYASA